MGGTAAALHIVGVVTGHTRRGVLVALKEYKIMLINMIILK